MSGEEGAAGREDEGGGKRRREERRAIFVRDKRHHTYKDLCLPTCKKERIESR